MKRRLATTVHEEDYISLGIWFVCRIEAETYFVPVLFWAIRNVFERSADADAMEIFTTLMDHGSDVEFVVPFVIICHVKGFDWKKECHVTPETLALFLKQHAVTTHQSEAMDCVLHKLNEAIVAQTNGTSTAQEMVRIPRTVVDTYAYLLFNQEFGDVRFKCKDRVIVHAHKAILAAASPYFSSMFGGAWAESSNGIIKTPQPSTIIRAVLSFVYTGTIDNDTLTLHASTLLAVAGEYMLTSLQKEAERQCLRSLSKDNIRGILEIAHAHEIASLKASCYLFVRRNAAMILTESSMMTLPIEEPALWLEMTAAISIDPPHPWGGVDVEGGGQNRGEKTKKGAKRART